MKRARKVVEVGAFVILLFFSGGCDKTRYTENGGGFESVTSPSGSSIQIVMGVGQIKEIYFNGTPIFGGTGGYYIIGNCPGNSGDGPDNIVSYLDRGNGKMTSTSGRCEDVPYSLNASVDEKRQAVVINVTVGPVPSKYVLSLPFDAAKRAFDRFEFGGVSNYQVGCADNWEGRNGGSGYFRNIPTPCSGIGAARTFSATYLEISGLFLNIRRTTSGSGVVEYLFYNHPGTHNIEVGLQGSRFYNIREEIVFSSSFTPIISTKR